MALAELEWVSWLKLVQNTGEDGSWHCKNGEWLCLGCEAVCHSSWAADNGTSIQCTSQIADLICLREISCDTIQKNNICSVLDGFPASNSTLEKVHHGIIITLQVPL